MVSQADHPLSERRSGLDRRRRNSYRFYDRRSAFDRRELHLLLGTMRDCPWLLVLVLVSINALSWLDGLLTWVELGAGIAREGNPVLAGLYAQNPVLAIGVKMGLVLAVSIAIWHGRHYRIMLALAVGALVVFGAVLAFHLAGLHGLGLL